MTLWAAPANAAGPLYAVPTNPPPETESVGFTNALNDRVRHLPAPLDPPTAQSPAEVEARVRALERGVVIARGNGGESKKAKRPPVHSTAGNEDSDTEVLVAANEPDDRGPLSLAFVAAGALALVGLLLIARGRHVHSPRQA